MNAPARAVPRPATRHSTAAIFAIPALLGIATLIALIIGLTGEGARDWIAWALLATPILAFARAWRRRERAVPCASRKKHP